jgi:hypothetical protein
VNFGSRSGYRLIGNRRSDPSVRTKLSDFIFSIILTLSSYSTSFFTDVTGLVMCSIWKDHPIASIFVLYRLVYISSVGNWAFFKKNHSHLVLIDRDFHPLVLSDNLNGHRTDWMNLLQAQNFRVVLMWREVNLVRALILANPQLSWYDVNLKYYIVFILIRADWGKIWAGREDNRTLDQSDQ